MSLVLIAVVKFGATIDSTSVFPLKFAKADVLPSALCMAVVLLLLNFLPRMITDLGLFVEGEHRIKQFIWKAKVDAAVDEARKVDDDAYGPHEDEEGGIEPDDWWIEVGRVRDAAAKAEETMNARLGRQTLKRLDEQVSVEDEKAESKLLVELTKFNMDRDARDGGRLQATGQMPDWYGELLLEVGRMQSERGETQGDAQS